MSVQAFLGVYLRFRSLGNKLLQDGFYLGVGLD